MDLVERTERSSVALISFTGMVTSSKPMAPLPPRSGHHRPPQQPRAPPAQEPPTRPASRRRRHALPLAPSQAGRVDWPVSVALAQSVPELPTGTDWSYEMKLDGHRMIMWRTGDGVRLPPAPGETSPPHGATSPSPATTSRPGPSSTERLSSSPRTDGSASRPHKPEPPPPPPAPTASPPNAPPTTSPSTPCNCHRRTGTYEQGLQRAPRSPPQPPGRTARAHPDPGRLRHHRPRQRTHLVRHPPRPGRRRHRRQTHHLPLWANRTGAWLKIRHADTIEAAPGSPAPRASRGHSPYRLPDGRVALSSA